jgi:hypothetical protein
MGMVPLFYFIPTERRGIMENEVYDQARGEMTEQAPGNVGPAESGSGDRTDELLKIMKKQLLASRINAIMLAGILCTALVFGIIIGPGLIKTITLANKSLSMVNTEIIPMIENVNVDSLNGAVGELKDAVAEFDVDSMNTAVKSLQQAVSNIDTKTLNAAISALNDTLQPLAKFFGGGS